MPIIANISLAYSQDKHTSLQVLEAINFELFENEVIAIVGKSGAGKSSLLRILAGLLEPTSGALTYKGKAVTSPLNAIRMVFQNYALLPWLNVLDNVLFGSDALGELRDISEPKALRLIQKIG